MNPPGAALQVQPQNIMTGDEARAYAKELAESNMISPFFRGSIPNMLYAMELGRVYGLEAATVLQNIHVFEGTDKKTGNTVLKAGMSAVLMETLARNAGHLIHVTANPMLAEGKLIRCEFRDRELVQSLKDIGEDPKEALTFEAMWNTAKTVKAELHEKGVWIKFPESMNAARVKSSLVRLGASEVLIQLTNTASRIGGLEYEGVQIGVDFTHTAEELGEDISDEGETVRVSAQERHEAKLRSRQQEQPERETVTVRRGDPEQDRRLADAELKARAASDPSQAGWHQKTEETATPVPNEAIKNFVVSRSTEDIAVWTRQTLLSDDTSAEDKAGRIGMVMNLLIEHCDIDKVAAVVTALNDLDGLESAQKVDLIGSLHKAAKASGVLGKPVEGSENLNALIVATVRPLMAASSGS